MTRLIASLFVVGTAAAGCVSSAGAPELPRPIPSTAATTTTTLVTTTATAAAEGPADTCPSVFCLVYHIDASARWSDGTRVTADDFLATVRAWADPRLTPEPGYDLISDFEVIDDKTLRLGFTEPYGAWPTLFDRLLAAGSEDLGLEEMPVTGPFRLVEWVPGDRIVVERQPRWWPDADPISGVSLGEVTEIRFVFIEDVDDMVTALRSGDVDVIIARPEEGTVGRLDRDDDIAFTVVPGPFWEHIDFHHEDPILSQLWLREAIALAIDREKILDRTVRLIDPEAKPLDNTLWMTGSTWYESHITDAHDPAAATQMMIDHSCARGEDSVFVCGGRRMSFVWASTDDDPARREIFESVAEDLAVVGIELIGDFRPPSTFLSPDYLFGPSRLWQLINFSWRARSDPSGVETTYRCEGELNVNRYCSDPVEAMFRTISSITDPSLRAAAFNDVDRLYLTDLAVIPLYQKPTMMAWSAAITGPMPNITSSSDLWNVAAWTGKTSLVIALPAEPSRLDPFVRGDDGADIVLSTLLYGAFGMTPSNVLIPVLLDSVDVIEGEG